MMLHVKSERAEGVITISVGRTVDTGQLGLWIEDVAGKVMGGIKTRVQTIRDMLTTIELTARRFGCELVVIEGRMKWAAPIRGMGYEMADVAGVKVLRKRL